MDTTPAKQLDLGINVSAANFVRHGLYADILLDIETAALAGKTFTYHIPPGMTVQPGMLVDVPFASNPSRMGYVLSVTDTGPQVTKPIRRVLTPAPLLDADRLRWLADLADYTATPLAQVMTTALPAALFRGKQVASRQIRHIKTQRVVTPLADTAPTARQQQVLQKLWASGPLPVAQAIRQLSVTDTTLKRMASLQLVSIMQEEVATNAMQDLIPNGDVLSMLTPAQSDVVAQFMASPKGTSTWLQGVTGSGKTQVYMAIAAQLLAQGFSVLMLVPEIALTSQLAQRFMRTFDGLALWHSQLSAGERVDTWWRTHRGDCRLVIGPRSAMFLPMQNLGAILIDEAHDASFKQDTPAPRYDTRIEAERLARYLPDCRVLCGSATPDVSLWHRALSQHATLTLTERFGQRDLAKVNLIDMRSEKQLGQAPIVSATLLNALTDTLAQQQQAIVLVNRRGFYTLLSCTACDHSLTCPHCTVALTVHQPTQTVRCHYCGWEAPVPQFCPACGNFDLRQSGVGTQRVTHALQERLPTARILRLDSDTMRHKNGHLPILRQFADGGADILVGTQMVAKGLDVGNVTCVGIIGGDSGLNLPDYMAAERTFQLLTQVAGRAGRGDHPGQVWLQTRLPHHPVIHFARGQDTRGFYEYELTHRQAEGFPPFSQLIRVLVSGEDEAEAHRGIQWVTDQMRQILQPFDTEFLGPAPCAIAKIQDKYRFQLLVKNRDGEVARKALANWYLSTRFPKTLTCLVDVDSQSML